MNKLTKIIVYGIFSNFYPERALFLIYYISLGFSAFQIAGIQAVISFTQFIFEIPTGYLSDKIGRKKIMLSSVIFILMYYVLLVLSNEFSTILIANLFLGLGLTLSSGADESYIKENFENYTKVYTMYGTITMISSSLSLVIGGIIATYNWKIVFLVAAIIHLCSFLIVIFLKDKSVLSSQMKNSSLKQSISKIFKFKNVNIIIVFILIDSFFWFFYMKTQVIFANFGLSIINITIFYLISSIIVFIITNNNKLEKFTNKYIFKILITTVILFIIKPNLLMSFLSLILSQVFIFNYFPEISNKIHLLLEDKERNFVISTLYSLVSIFIWMFFQIDALFNEYFKTDITFVLFLIILVALLIKKKQLK